MVDRAKVVIVTGASRGIGAATALMAAEQGFSVAVNCHQSPDAAAGVAKAIEDSGGRAAVIAGDVAEEADVVHLFDETERRLGPITALVNNAGVTGTSGRLDALGIEDLTRVLPRNGVGAFVSPRRAVR